MVDFSPGSIIVPMYQDDQEGVSPPGWEETIQKWKRQKTGGKSPAKNPWALAWYLKKRGVKPLASANDEFSLVDSAAMTEYGILEGHGVVPRVYSSAAHGELWAQAVLLSPGTMGLYQEV